MFPWGHVVEEPSESAAVVVLVVGAVPVAQTLAELAWRFAEL